MYMALFQKLGRDITCHIKFHIEGYANQPLQI